MIVLPVPVRATRNNLLRRQSLQPAPTRVANWIPIHTTCTESRVHDDTTTTSSSSKDHTYTCPAALDRDVILAIGLDRARIRCCIDFDIMHAAMGR